MPKAVRKAHIARKMTDLDLPPTQNRTLVTRCHPDDVLDPEKIGGRAGDSARRSVTVNMREHAIGWLYHRTLITGIQFAAAEKLRADYERAGLVRMSMMQWTKTADKTSRRAGASPHEPTLAQIDAKRRFYAAIDAAGPGLADICWRLICANETLTGAEKALGWPARSGRIVLGIALDRLADHYGLRR
ncbi:hypothetical protein DMP17_05570 [Pseudonocardia sp. TMWB2A]